jgi:hypothetical protein
LIIMRAQRPVAVQAGLFGDLCLPTFGSVSRCRFNKDTIVTHDFIGVSYRLTK